MISSRVLFSSDPPFEVNALSAPQVLTFWNPGDEDSPLSVEDRLVFPPFGSSFLHDCRPDELSATC